MEVCHDCLVIDVDPDEFADLLIYWLPQPPLFNCANYPVSIIFRTLSLLCKTGLIQ
jgi:hypothetical protein